VEIPDPRLTTVPQRVNSWTGAPWTEADAAAERRVSCILNCVTAAAVTMVPVSLAYALYLFYRSVAG
jgi:hypothetical protein